MPTTCSCGAKLDYQHCMSCKKGGFVTMRHNDVRDLTANILKAVLNDVEVEPQLLPLTGENLQYQTVIRGDEARLVIRARELWERGQQAFLDVRVLTQTQVGTITHQSNNATTSTKKKKNVTKTYEFYKLIMVVSHHSSFHRTEEWEENAKRSTPD